MKLERGSLAPSGRYSSGGVKFPDGKTRILPDLPPDSGVGLQMDAMLEPAIHSFWQYLYFSILPIDLHNRVKQRRRQNDCTYVAWARANEQGPGLSNFSERTSEEGEVTHFITMTFWISLDVIRGFAGDDAELAKYYPEDKDFLLEFEPQVVHYEVVGQS